MLLTYKFLPPKSLNFKQDNWGHNKRSELYCAADLQSGSILQFIVAIWLFPSKCSAGSYALGILLPCCLALKCTAMYRVIHLPWDRHYHSHPEVLNFCRRKFRTGLLHYSKHHKIKFWCRAFVSKESSAIYVNWGIQYSTLHVSQEFESRSLTRSIVTLPCSSWIFAIWGDVWRRNPLVIRNPYLLSLSLALAEYHAKWRIMRKPQTAVLMFVVTWMEWLLGASYVLWSVLGEWIGVHLQCRRS